MKSFGNQQSYSIVDAVVVCGKPLHSGGRIGVVADLLSNGEYKIVFSANAMYAGYQINVAYKNLRLATQDELENQTLSDALAEIERIKINEMYEAIKNNGLTSISEAK